MAKFEVMYEEKLTYHRVYEIEAKDEEDLIKITEQMDNAGIEGGPDEFVPDEALISNDDYDHRSPVEVEYEYFDHNEIKEG